MILYGSSMSPYVRKVLAFAAEKDMDLDLKGTGLGAEELKAASPFGKMPAFSDGDYHLADSSAIIAYLEALQPDPNLIPEEPRARGRTIWYDEFADTILMACGRKLFFNRIVAPKFLERAGDLAEADAAERDELPPILDYLDGSIPASGYLVEDRLTLADIAVVSPLVNLAHVGIALARWPTLAAYADAILSRDSFRPWVDRETAFLAKIG